MKIYLDNCCYNRPFDDQSQIRIHLETQAKLYIQSKIREGTYDLVWSYILDYENGKNPYEEKRLAIAPWKKISSFCAVAARCEYYLTTDKKLLNTSIPEIKIVNPIVFVNEMEG